MIDPQSGASLCLPSSELIECWALNERMNQIVLQSLDPTAWRAPMARVRTIAAIVAHMHNVRRKWLRLSAPHLKLPAPLDRTRCTREKAVAALTESAACCMEMLTEALSHPAPSVPSRVPAFTRDGWSKPWPAGPLMVAYMMTHEAHHRGQICMLAHQLGFPLPARVTSKMWAWENLSRRM